MDTVAETLALVVKATDAASGVINRVQASVGSLEAKTGRMSAAMTAAGGKISRGWGIAAGLVGGYATKLSLDFEQAFTHIEALVGVSAEQTARLKQEVLELAPAVGKAPQELAEALYFIESSGLKGAAAMRALTASAKASAAGLGETKVIADAVTSAINAYGESHLSASRAVSIMLAAVREGKNEPDEFAAAIGRVIPVAQAMGVDFGEVAGTMAAMSLNGTDAYEAVTQITAGLVQAIKPTKEGAGALKSIHMTYASLRDVISKQGLAAAFELLKAKFKGNIESVGAVLGNVRSLRGALTLTGASAEKYAGIIDRVSGAQRDADKAFETASGKTAFKLQQAWAKLKVALIGLGDALMPAITKVVGWFTKLLDAASRLPSGFKQAALGVGVFLAVLGPLLSTGGRVLGLFSTLLGGVRRFTASLAALRGMTLAAELATIGGGVGTVGSEVGKAAAKIAGTTVQLSTAGQAMSMGLGSATTATKTFATTAGTVPAAGKAAAAGLAATGAGAALAVVGLAAVAGGIGFAIGKLRELHEKIRTVELPTGTKDFVAQYQSQLKKLMEPVTIDGQVFWRYKVTPVPVGGKDEIDFSDIEKRIDRAVQKAQEKLRANVQVKADMPMLDSLERQAQVVKKLRDQMHELEGQQTATWRDGVRSVDFHRGALKRVKTEYEKQKATLEAMRDTWERLHTEEGKVKPTRLDLNITEATTKVKVIKAALAQLSKEKATPEVRLYTKWLQKELADVQAQLKKLTGYKNAVQITADAKAMRHIPKEAGEAAQQAGEEVRKGYEKAAAKLRGKANPLVEAATSPLKGLRDKYRRSGENAGTGLAQGLRSKIGEVQAAAGEVANAAIVHTRGKFAEKSPSRVFWEIGRMVVLGLIGGISEKKQAAAEAMSSVVSAVLSSVEGLSQIGGAIGNVPALKLGTWRRIGASVSAAVDAMTDGVAASLSKTKISEKLSEKVGRVGEIAGALASWVTMLGEVSSDAVRTALANWKVLRTATPALSQALRRLVQMVALPFDGVYVGELLKGAVSGGAEIAQSLFGFIQGLGETSADAIAKATENWPPLRDAAPRLARMMRRLVAILRTEFAKVADPTKLQGVVAAAGEIVQNFLGSLTALGALTDDVLARAEAQFAALIGRAPILAGYLRDFVVALKTAIGKLELADTVVSLVAGATDSLKNVLDMVTALGAVTSTALDAAERGWGLLEPKLATLGGYILAVVTRLADILGKVATSDATTAAVSAASGMIGNLKTMLEGLGALTDTVLQDAIDGWGRLEPKLPALGVAIRSFLATLGALLGDIKDSELVATITTNASNAVGAVKTALESMGGMTDELIGGAVSGWQRLQPRAAEITAMLGEFIDKLNTGLSGVVLADKARTALENASGMLEKLLAMMTSLTTVDSKTIAAAQAGWDLLFGLMRNAFMQASPEAAASAISLATTIGTALKDALTQHLIAVTELVRTWARAVGNYFDGVARSIDGIRAAAASATAAIKELVSEIGSLNDTGTGGLAIPQLASGGIVTRPTLALIGEAGPEAVVPLNRSVGGQMVDQRTYQIFVVGTSYTQADAAAIIGEIRRQNIETQMQANRCSVA